MITIGTLTIGWWLSKEWYLGFTDAGEADLNVKGIQVGPLNIGWCWS